MDKAFGYAAYALVVPFQLAQKARMSRARVTTDQYLENLSDVSLLAGLSDVLTPFTLKDERLEQIFDKFATPSSSGGSIWNESSFTNFFAGTHGDADTSTAPLSFLWQLFSSAAYFPVHSVVQLSTGTIAEVDHDGFTRAFTLLVKGAFALLGYKRDSHASFVQKENETLRSTRFMMSCIVCPSELASENGSEESWMAETILDAIYLGQPPSYEGTLVSKRISSESFEDAARRLISNLRGRPNTRQVGLRIRREDLHSLLSLSMLVALENRVWREGVTVTKGTGLMAVRSAYTTDGVLFSRLIVSSDAVELANNLARGIMNRHFDESDDFISSALFEQYCQQHPAFILFFSHVGASIFSMVGSASRFSYGGPTAMPIPVANALSLMSVATFFDQDDEDADQRASQVQFNVDLHAAQQFPVSPGDSPPASLSNMISSAAALEKVLTQGLHFHVLLISAPNHLIAVFVTPRDDPDLQIWSARRDGARGHVKYSWRSTYVHLRPEVITSDAGPVHAVTKQDQGASDEEEVLVFETHRYHDSAGGDSGQVGGTRMRLDLRNRTFEATDDRAKDIVQPMEWTSIKCYRMPEVASRMTKGS